MLFWALLASGQITMRKVDGWQTLATKATDAVMSITPLCEVIAAKNLFNSLYSDRGSH
jgi:hypothetical protein